MSGEARLAGQTVVVIGGSSGIGLETARRTRAEGADVQLGANARRLDRVLDQRPEVTVTRAQPSDRFELNASARTRHILVSIRG